LPLRHDLEFSRFNCENLSFFSFYSFLFKFFKRNNSHFTNFVDFSKVSHYANLIENDYRLKDLYLSLDENTLFTEDNLNILYWVSTRILMGDESSFLNYNDSNSPNLTFLDFQCTIKTNIGVENFFFFF